MDHAGKKAGNHKGKRTATPVRAVKQPKRKSMPVQEQAGSQKGVHEELVEQMALLADANDAIIGYDAGFRVVFWNDMACSLYGYSSKEALEAGPKTRVCEGEGGSRGLYRWSP